MPRTKKDSDLTNGRESKRTATSTRGRGRPPSKSPDGDALLEVTVQPEGLHQFREAREHLIEIVRLAKEARQELEEIRQIARAARPPDAKEAPKRADRKAREPANDRAESHRDTRNRLGVTVGSGVIIANVLPDTPAMKAGLVRGDVIEMVNGSPIVSATQLRDAIHKTNADAEVTLHIVRAGKAQDVKARLAARPHDDKGANNQNRLGVTVGPGVVVAEVLPDTPADRAGVERGDVIDAVNKTDVSSSEHLRHVVQELPAGAEAVLRVARAGKARDVKVRLNGGGGSA